jgi:hypothetical protein
MNFFRSEEHLRRWEGYEEKMVGGVITLDSLIQLFTLPYMKNRGRPDYVSHFSEYMADLVGEIDKLPDAGDFWKLSPFQKAAFNLARKLGLM